MRVTAAPARTVVDGGWALTAWPLDRRLSYLPTGADDLEPPYAAADAWPPPHPLSLSANLCDRILVAASYSKPTPSGNGTYFHDPELTDADRQQVLERFQRANEVWWQVEVTRWELGVKRYEVGERHAPHQDLHAGAARRKFAGTVQLSDPADYEGGQLVMHFAEDRAVMPVQRGTLVALPGWTVHEVTPVTAGERWSLCVNAWGSPLR